MAIGQGGYKGNLEEIMDSLGPQSGGGQFFKDFLDHKQNKQVPTQSPSFLDKPLLTGVADAGEGVYNYFSQTPEFLSDMWGFMKEAWSPQFEGHVPFLDATGVGAVGDTALTLGSAFATGAVSGLEGTARGFSLDESGWPTWSGADAADAIEHRAANFPSYHPQTTLGRDVESGIGSFMEGWMENVADPLGRGVQSVAEFAGVPKESAIKWGGATSGAVSAAPMALPLLKRSRVSSDRPMYGYGYDAKNLRLALEDQIGAVKDFQFMSDAWRKTNPEAWKAALDKDQLLKDGSFAREIERMQDVITQDLREVSFFIDEYSTTEGLRIGAGLPKETFSDYISRIRDETRRFPSRGPDARLRYGQSGRDVALDPLTGSQGGYFHTTNRQTPLFQRDATGKMLPNWGRGYPYEHPLGRQRHIVVGKEGPAINNRWTPKHEWTHALDDILYSRLARETTNLDRFPPMWSPNIGMVPDYMGNMRWIPDLTRYNRSNTMMSDLSPILKDFSEKIVEVEWTKYTERVWDRAYTAVEERLIGEGATEAEAGLIARQSGRKAVEEVEATKQEIIGAEEGIWATRSPLELRARLTGANDYLALAKKQTYDKLQNPTGSRPFKLEDLWTEKIPPRVREVRNMIDDLVAYDVMTRVEATAYLKKVLDEVREPYTKLTTEVKLGPGPGLINGGEE